MLINQVIGEAWARPRPYDVANGIHLLTAPSGDPSFPSDHATAAFALRLALAGRGYVCAASSCWRPLCSQRRVLRLASTIQRTSPQQDSPATGIRGPVEPQSVRFAPHPRLSFSGDNVSMRILFAEDEPTIREFVTRGLEEAGYAVDAVSDGDEAWLAAQTVDYDVVILDVSMPGADGFEVCRRIRARAQPGPGILFLTARDATADRVTGLDLGAEDYLVKPFAFAELLARVRAVLRRGPTASPVLAVEDLMLDPAARKVTRAGVEIKLTAKEFALLEYLMRNAGRVVTKTMIAEHVWNFDLDAESNFIEVFIYALRKKVDVPFGSALIHTVRGTGYKVDVSNVS